MREAWDLLFPLLAAIGFGLALRSDLRSGTTGVGNVLFANVRRDRHPVGYWAIIVLFAVTTVAGGLAFLLNLVGLLT